MSVDAIIAGELGRSFISGLEKQAREICVNRNNVQESGASRISVLPTLGLGFEISNESGEVCAFELSALFRLTVRYPQLRPTDRSVAIILLVRKEKNGFSIWRGSERVHEEALLNDAFDAMRSHESLLYVA
jgi:hypothetical protein